MVCEKHECLLYQSPVEIEEPFKTSLATRGICDRGEILKIDGVGAASLKMARAVASFSVNTQKRNEQGEFFEKQQWYREQLELRGFRLGENLVQLNELSKHIVATFGAPFLQWVGLYRRGQAVRDWVVPLLCEGQAVPPTVAHALLRIFLSQCDTDEGSLRTPFVRRLDVACPASTLPYPIDECAHLVSQFHKRDAEISAICVCGCAFRVRVTGNQCEVVKIVRLGKSYRRCAEQLHATGLQPIAIAQEMKVSVMSVRRMLGARHSSNHLETCDVELRRAQWRALFETGTCCSLQEARRQHQALYRFLLTNSREWMDRFQKTLSAPSQDRVDWPSRDLEYSARFELASRELMDAWPPRCVSKISILFVSGVKLGTRNQLGKLPLCRKVLAEQVESMRDFRKRSRTEAERQSCIPEVARMK
jgi:hypothetical protein